jgi:hypothetical protein
LSSFTAIFTPYIYQQDFPSLTSGGPALFLFIPNSSLLLWAYICSLRGVPNFPWTSVQKFPESCFYFSKNTWQLDQICDKLEEDKYINIYTQLLQLLLIAKCSLPPQLPEQQHRGRTALLYTKQMFAISHKKKMLFSIFFFSWCYCFSTSVSDSIFS